MAIQLIWEEKYSVDHPLMDEQHQQVFKIVNDLPEVSDLENLKKVAGIMDEHARKHFSEEEELLKEAGFPEFEDHQEMHQEIISLMNRPMDHPSEFTDDQAAVRYKLLVFEKVIEHIAVQDMVYAGQLRK